MRISRTGVYALILENHQTLLVKQQKGPHAGKFDLPGGGIEFGETIEEALRRELSEEIGMSFTSMKLINNYTATTADFYQIGLIYEVKGLIPLPSPTELEWLWVNQKELAVLPLAPLAILALSTER